jgi:membrane-associated phospholipid phosphatase
MQRVRACARFARTRGCAPLAALLLALLGAPGSAHADEPSVALVVPPLRWDPAWVHANAWDYTLSGTGATALVLETIFLQSKQEPVRFSGPILFDAAARSFFRANDPNTRLAVADTSWVFWGLDVVYPLVDVAYARARYGPDVARDLFWQDATVLTAASSVDMALRDTVGRARPNDSDCLAAGGGSKCLNPESVRSFPSGHFVETTTGASLICTQHLYLKLYGPPWDAVTCATAMVSAATVGVMRMVADDHWATDVVGSGALGVLFGWGMPYLMHLRWHTPPKTGGGAEPHVMVMPTPIAFSHGAGIGITGIVF